MIVQSFPTKTPVKQHNVVTYPDNSVYANAGKRKITVDEWHRRNKIVKELFAECDVKQGLSYLPKAQSAIHQYGVCKVEKLFRNYWDFPIHEEWPKDDHPYIITVSPERGTKNGGLILCTNKWLDPKPITICS